MRTRSFFLLVLAIEAVAIAIALIAGLAVGKPDLHFRERGFITWVSSAQLLGVAWLAFAIHRARRSALSGSLWSSPLAIWPLMAIGFAFLAADDLFRIHERLHHSVLEKIFDPQNPSLRDRLGNFVLLAYALAGFAVLIACRKELWRIFPLWPYFIAGVAVADLMLVLDAATENEDLIRRTLTSSDETALSIRKWSAVAEDSAKIIAEGFFLAAFHAALGNARAKAAATSQNSAQEQ